MILGLLWQFILRYHIVGADDNSVRIALKKLLLIWLQHVIPERKITNLTTDWNDGVALCNLIEVLQPGLCPEYNRLDRNDSIENAAKGTLMVIETDLALYILLSVPGFSSLTKRFYLAS